MKREAELRSKFLAELRRQIPTAVAIRHEDTLQSGTPDLTLTLSGRTGWVEFKHATPDFSGTGLQEKMCRDLAREGWCRYVVWWEDGLSKLTLVIHPAVVMASAGRPQCRKPAGMIAEAATSGFDHKWLVEYFQRVHAKGVLEHG